MYLGVDYYPEHWDIELLESDLESIYHMGANIIRIGEFAWHMMEQTEGNYDFSFFDMVINRAKQHKLKVIFGTPTATFPAWLVKKHPTILSTDEFGHSRVFGGRRQYCYNSKIYQEYTDKLLKKLVNHYGEEEAIIVWQIDNELGHEGSDFCYCEQCHRAFQRFLKIQYKEIAVLNEIYGAIFWGQTYNDFDEIPLPQPTITTHNPTLRLDWARFRSHSINHFGRLQIDRVNQLKGKHQRVTHNFFGGFFERAYDQNIMAASLDFVSYDHYPVWGGLSKPIEPAHIAMNLDYIRGLKKDNFWIMEAIMGAQGHDIIGYLPRPNQAKMWAYQALAHGCNNLLFFRWRGMNRGAEQFCLGIIDHDNEKRRKYYEVQSFMQNAALYKEIINSRIEAEVALLYDFNNIWSWYFQPQSSDFDFTNELIRLYKPFYRYNVNLDVISIQKDLSNYKVLVIPVMQVIEKDLASRLESFANDGGTIIFSFRAGIKDCNNNIHFKKVFPCYISDIAGIQIHEAESLLEGQRVEIISQEKNLPNRGQCSVWRDLITPTTARVLYRYDDHFYSDKACITANRFGNGKVYYVGGGVSEDILEAIIKEIILLNEIEHIEAPLGLEVTTRRLDDEVWQFINNHTAEAVHFQGNLIEPYGSFIIKK